VAFESGSRLERIEKFAFYGSGLESIEIPPNVAFIGGYAFDPPFLRSIWLSPAHQHLRIRESFLEDICGSTIYRYFGSCRSIEIPSSVVVLGEGSFASCYSLESVTFESGSRLERIEERAFYGSRLKSIEIPPCVSFICGSALVTLSSISVSRENRHFRIRDSFLEDISGSTIYRYFGSCRSIVIPSFVVVLGKRSFLWCESLESVTFESGSRLERIEESMFERTRVNFGLLSQELTRSRGKQLISSGRLISRASFLRRTSRNPRRNQHQLNPRRHAALVKPKLRHHQSHT
jgi:hypothetical protein